MPVGKGSIERAVKAKNAAEAKTPAAKKAPAKKAEESVQETVIAATSPEVMEMVIGKRPEKPVRVGEQMPDWLL